VAEHHYGVEESTIFLTRKIKAKLGEALRPVPYPVRIFLVQFGVIPCS
jgi:hypothetical protein